jgi:hypothetical protein
VSLLVQMVPPLRQPLRPKEPRRRTRKTPPRPPDHPPGDRRTKPARYSIRIRRRFKRTGQPQFFAVLKSTVNDFFSGQQNRPDVAYNCPHRGPFLRTAQCEIGCLATRKTLPVFVCREHGECSPWRFKENAVVVDGLTCPDKELRALQRPSLWREVFHWFYDYAMSPPCPALKYSIDLRKSVLS